MFFRIQVFEGIDCSESSFFRVRVQGPGPGFRSSRKKIDYKKLLKTQISLNPLSTNILFTIRDYSFPL